MPRIGLFAAASLGESETILEILKESETRDVEMRDPNGRTMLWLAASEGRLGTLKMLLSLGASPTVICEGRRPIEIAFVRGQPHIVYFLKAYFSKYPELNQALFNVDKEVDTTIQNQNQSESSGKKGNKLVESSESQQQHIDVVDGVCETESDWLKTLRQREYTLNGTPSHNQAVMWRRKLQSNTKVETKFILGNSSSNNGSSPNGPKSQTSISNQNNQNNDIEKGIFNNNNNNNMSPSTVNNYNNDIPIFKSGWPARSAMKSNKQFSADNNIDLKSGIEKSHTSIEKLNELSPFKIQNVKNPNGPNVTGSTQQIHQLPGRGSTNLGSSNTFKNFNEMMRTGS